MSDDTDTQTLRRRQGLIPLTALGVGAVISGDFFGWNYGLERGGFGGLIVATILVGIMYVSVSLCLAELAAMYPSAEGAFAFSRRAFGPYSGFLCGLSEALEYVLLVPVILTGLGDHLNLLFEIDDANIQIVWWLVLSLLYLVIHIWGPSPTFWSNTIITGLSLLTLLLFWCCCLSIMGSDSPDTINDRIYNIEPEEKYGGTKFFPKGFYGVFTSLTFAAWFFIAVEELPLAGEDAVNPTKTIPRALIGSISILMVTAFLTCFFAVSVPGGSFNIANTGAPLVRSLLAGLMDDCVNFNELQKECKNSDSNCKWNSDEDTCWDNNLSSEALAWEVVINIGTLIGLMTSCHAIIFAGGRQLMSLTRNGAFHPWTRFDKVTNGTPRIALATDIILAFIVTLVVYLIGEGVDFLLGLSVAAACVSYMFSMASFIKLRLTAPDEERPYTSPLGIVGAVYAFFIAFCIGISFFVDIAFGLGVGMLCGVLFGLLGVYALASVEFLWEGRPGGAPSGRQRFADYEENSKVETKSKIEIGSQTQITGAAGDDDAADTGLTQENAP